MSGNEAPQACAPGLREPFAPLVVHNPEGYSTVADLRRALTATNAQMLRVDAEAHACLALLRRVGLALQPLLLAHAARDGAAVFAALEALSRQHGMTLLRQAQVAQDEAVH